MTLSTGIDQASRLARAYRVAEVVAAAWKAEAQAYGLKSTLNLYKRAIQIREVSANHVIISLSGIVPLMIEEGVAAHDMRAYLLRTQRPGASPIRYVKSGPRKGEPYRYIMFRRTAADIKEYGGRGAQTAARQLAPSMSATGGRLLIGGRYSNPSAHFINKLGIRSTSPALSGMVRLEATTTTAAGAPGTNTTYAAWRTVSTKRADAWQHPGRPPANLAARVAAQIPQLVQAAGL
jgi:hypothetical protein